MTKVIEFYVPNSLPKKANYLARSELGKLIEFSSSKRNQRNSNHVQSQGMGAVYMAPFAVNFEGGRPDGPK